MWTIRDQATGEVIMGLDAKATYPDARPAMITLINNNHWRLDLIDPDLKIIWLRKEENEEKHEGKETVQAKKRA